MNDMQKEIQALASNLQRSAWDSGFLAGVNYGTELALHYQAAEFSEGEPTRPVNPYKKEGTTNETP